jgi:DNA helicase II / ATP-dependent DNA helicase PcrA
MDFFALTSIDILSHYPSMSSILEGLNDNQTQAVNMLTGATLVIAGAGSGKTAVLTRRVANLIVHRVPGGQILCLTFTNKAAKEMNHRVQNLLNKEGIRIPPVRVWEYDYSVSPLLCTFHALGVRLLKEYGEKIGIKPEFTVIDEDDRKKIIKELIKDNNLDPKKVQVSFVGYFFSQCKQELLGPEESKTKFSEYPPFMHKLYSQYELKLKNNNNVDFDDLIYKTYLVLSGNVDVQNELHARWSHIMVDEYQDTNHAQFKILELLSPDQLIQKEIHRSIFVVGDDAQSIYGFRGSRVELILEFGKHYHNSNEITLNQNYRSTQPILNLAERVIGLNPKQYKKNLFTNNPAEIKVRYYQSRSEFDESRYIVKKLAELYQTKKTESPKSTKLHEVTYNKSKPDSISELFDNIYQSLETSSTSFSYDEPVFYEWDTVEQLNDTAILYRTHTQSRAIEEALIKSKIPYKLVSGVKFLERKEIKDTLAILKYSNNGADKLSLARFLPLILDGVGSKTTEKIIQYLEDESVVLAPKYQTKVMELMVKMQTCFVDNQSLIDFTKDILAKTGYFRYLRDQYPIEEEYIARMDNVGELFSIMLGFDEDPQLEVKERLNSFLDHVMLLTSQDDDVKDNVPKVSLMTLHQSKGLEFETVFLVGLDDGILPHSRSLMEPKEMEEEIRLAYVGVTRAKINLFLISANSRTIFGKVEFYQPSRIFKNFIDSSILRDR